MNKIKQWYVRNQDAISWFIIGALIVTAVNRLASQSYILCLIGLSVAFINYILIKIKLK
jgi:hypothetical protein